MVGILHPELKCIKNIMKYTNMEQSFSVLQCQSATK